ncbi:MAG: hypothetical protein CMM74_13865 [Rhodospirillaceae bacterium]|nr:hypothetical protein [Rhodospirillaceae bacterium]
MRFWNRVHWPKPLNLASKRRVSSTTGYSERSHETILQEFFQLMFRKKIYEDIDQLQDDLDLWINHYNNERHHQG